MYVCMYACRSIKRQCWVCPLWKKKGLKWVKFIVLYVCMYVCMYVPILIDSGAAIYTYGSTMLSSKSSQRGLSIDTYILPNTSKYIHTYIHTYIHAEMCRLLDRYTSDAWQSFLTADHTHLPLERSGWWRYHFKIYIHAYILYTYIHTYILNMSLLQAHLEVRQKDLVAARKILGTAIGTQLTLYTYIHTYIHTYIQTFRLFNFLWFVFSRYVPGERKLIEGLYLSGTAVRRGAAII